ncbi:MAG: Rieske 2Fe-2S domain-containing protein, partial [Rhodothermales bacterium]|nr:Rieske 2Fe-2S domain-containing protein [Rhodothermales bacterium]
QLTAPVWKKLHMLVYPAYALLVAHVAFGIVQDVRSPVPLVLLTAGVLWIIGLHIAAARREVPADRGRSGMSEDGFVDVCAATDIEDGRARIVTVSGERVAVFRHGDRFSAISNVCQHQNGPLGEGRIVDGLVTCPWHGYQYCPVTGRSPEPFTESVPTFDVRLVGDRIHVQSRPNPEGSAARTIQFPSDRTDGGPR